MEQAGISDRAPFTFTTHTKQDANGSSCVVVAQRRNRLDAVLTGDLEDGLASVGHHPPAVDFELHKRHGVPLHQSL